MVKDFRFGVSLFDASSRAKVHDVSRRAEELGFDVIHVPDHLGAPAPFPTLMSAAAATSTLRLGTFVLNSAFYRPALLARDVGALRDLTDGRFELGLGTGYVREEFEAAELPYPSARERIDHMQHVIEYMREHLPDVPILIAGNGDRVLTVAATRADIIGFTGGDQAPGANDPLAKRIEFVRNAAPERFDELELNIAITAMPIDGSGMPDLRIPRQFLPHLTWRAVGLDAGHGRPHPQSARHLRGQLHHRAGATRGSLREGDRRAALRQPSVSSERVTPS
jgi:probable F420-dependent oxidoreductase